MISWYNNKKLLSDGWILKMVSKVLYTILKFYPSDIYIYIYIYMAEKYIYLSVMLM